MSVKTIPETFRMRKCMPTNSTRHKPTENDSAKPRATTTKSIKTQNIRKKDETHLTPNKLGPEAKKLGQNTHRITPEAKKLRQTAHRITPGAKQSPKPSPSSPSFSTPKRPPSSQLSKSAESPLITWDCNSPLIQTPCRKDMDCRPAVDVEGIIKNFNAKKTRVLPSTSHKLLLFEDDEPQEARENLTKRVAVKLNRSTRPVVTRRSMASQLMRDLESERVPSVVSSNDTKAEIKSVDFFNTVESDPWMDDPTFEDKDFVKATQEAEAELLLAPIAASSDFSIGTKLKTKSVFGNTKTENWMNSGFTDDDSDIVRATQQAEEKYFSTNKAKKQANTLLPAVANKNTLRKGTADIVYPRNNGTNLKREKTLTQLKDRSNIPKLLVSFVRKSPAVIAEYKSNKCSLPFKTVQCTQSGEDQHHKIACSLANAVDWSNDDFFDQNALMLIDQVDNSMKNKAKFETVRASTSASRKSREVSTTTNINHNVNKRTERSYRCSPEEIAQKKAVAVQRLKLKRTNNNVQQPQTKSNRILKK